MSEADKYIYTKSEQKEQIKKAKKKTKLKENIKTSRIVFVTFVIILGLMALAIYVLSIADKDDSKITDNEISVNFSDNYVSNVIDGDTFELANGDRVRLICVDAPELGKAGANDSKTFLEILILNKDVRLEKDLEDKDNYGRLLRYVYVNDSFNEEVFVNKELVKEGYASVFRYGNDTKRCDEIEKEITD